MERARRERGNGEQAASRCIAQCRSFAGSRQNEAVTGLDNSTFVVAQRRKLQSMFGATVQMNEVSDVSQLQGVEEEEPLQGQFATAQFEGMEEEEPLQGKLEADQTESASQTTAHLQQDPASKPNITGLPDNLKTGIESFSGISMDNVRVHYDSTQPAQLNALAYTQGTDIHVAPGQERHLHHEAWHVVQQAQGRVKPTMQLQEGVPVNDDASLEHEADVMGEKAVE